MYIHVYIYILCITMLLQMDSDGNSGIQLEFLVAPWPRAQPVKGGPDRIRAVTKVVPHFVEGKSEANGTGISMIFLNVKWEET